MITDITPDHHAQFLKLNTQFVHWLSPLDEAGLRSLLSIAAYARQIKNAQAVLIGYPHDVNYPEHWNLTWLRQHFDNFFYIDRAIVDAASQGQKYGQQL